MYHNVVYLRMIKLKTKWFNKWSKKNQITDQKLLDTLKYKELEKLGDFISIKE